MFGDCDWTYIIGYILIIILFIIVLIIIVCAPEANYGCPGKEFILLILFYLYFLVALGPFYATIILILLLIIVAIMYCIGYGRFRRRSDNACDRHDRCESNNNDSTEC